MLAVGVMFLVIALIGTCGANMKNKILLICYIAATSVAAMTEIIGIFVYATSKTIFQENFETWYRGVFRLFGTESQVINRHIVEFFQIYLQCCGLTSQQDFIDQNFAVPNSCSYRFKNDQVQDLHISNFVPLFFQKRQSSKSGK